MSNSTTQTPIPGVTVETPSSIKMILTMAAIGLAAGILIVMTFQLTLPTITRNKAIALNKAVFDVVPGAKTKVVFKLDGETLVPMEGEDDSAVKFYACYDDAKNLVGIAMEASGQGFADILRILYGYSPQCNCVVGMKVLESKETPGLGDKIEKDENFLANFDALEAVVAEDGTSIVNPIVMVKFGEKTNPWQVEAITGATISSRAIANILNASTAVTAPLINKNLSVLEEGAE